MYQAYVPPTLSQEVTAAGLLAGATVLAYHDAAIYAQGDPRFIDHYARLSSDRAEVRDLKTLATESFQKVLWLTDAERVEAMREEVQRAWAGRLDTVVTEPEFIEFTMPGVNKSSALTALTKRLGVSREQVLAFGDGNNDVAMLRWAGLGVAMDHAKESARKAADLVAPRGDPETSFARAVEVVLGQGERGHAAA